MFSVMLTAMGVVFGDIGTSPLYTLKEAFSEHYGLVPNHDTMLGVLSLIIWSLILVVTVKYVAIIMRADNDGEGGILALMALTQRALSRHPKWIYGVGILGIFGVSLFFGDGVITPAMSVLSAVEGIEVAAPGVHTYVVIITVAILTFLFLAQRQGSERVGKAFGPITLVWFITIGLIGAINIFHNPEILKAINPYWGLIFFKEHDTHAIFVMGAVVLAVTGGEALYADMGHFGVQAIRRAWNIIVLPTLVLNYLGQGALILQKPSAIANPFFEAVPNWGLYPMVGLATAAAVIASQALITGAYSVSSQAMQLGLIPRMSILHTSHSAVGQIYVPTVNWSLFVLVIVTVVSFGSSAAMATAYGVSVTGTMLITTILMSCYVFMRWRVPRILFVCVVTLFVVVDTAFFYTNIVKFFDGAWFPLLLGVALFIAMRTWRRGRILLREKVRRNGIALTQFLPGLMLAPPTRVPGTAVFLTADPQMAPQALMHNLKHNKVLHQRNVLLTVNTLQVPYAPAHQRIKIECIVPDFFRVYVRFGFMDTPDIPSALMYAGDMGGVIFDPMDTTFFVGRETVIPSPDHGMPLWRDKLFAFMYRNAAPANAFFHIPGNRLVELGAQVEI